MATVMVVLEMNRFGKIALNCLKVDEGIYTLLIAMIKKLSN